MSNIHYASIRSLDISNGEGVGVALFVQGCPFHCYNCFNPETWDFDGGKEWTQEVKEKFLELIDRPYIKRVSILGGEPLADKNLDDVLDLVTEINKKYNFQKPDPANPLKSRVSEVEDADRIRLSSRHKNIWLYTGFRWEEVINTEHMKKKDSDFLIWNERAEIISKCDVVVDGRYIDSQRDITLKWRGSKNQRVISAPESLKQGKVITLV